MSTTRTLRRQTKRRVRGLEARWANLTFPLSSWIALDYNVVVNILL